MILLLFLLLGFFLANAADQYQIYARTIGAVNGTIARGYQSAMETMLINRVGAAIYFFSTSFYLESDGKVHPYLITISFGLLFLFFFNLHTINSLKNLNKVNKHLNREEESNNNIQQVPHFLKAAAFFATLFSILGLTLPYIAGMFFPEYRLTLANSGFIFNSIFTLVTTLIIDKNIAIMIDSGNSMLIRTASSVIIFKSFALLSMGLIPLIYFLTVRYF